MNTNGTHDEHYEGLNTYRWKGLRILDMHDANIRVFQNLDFGSGPAVECITRVLEPKSAKTLVMHSTSSCSNLVLLYITLLRYDSLLEHSFPALLVYRLSHTLIRNSYM